MKKKINIILVLVVIGLWGGVGYRFLSTYFFSDQAPGKYTNFDSGAAMDNIFVHRDTFSMEPIERDPFLDTRRILVRRTGEKHPLHTTVKPDPGKALPKPEVSMVWPDIRYYGYIKSGDSDELVLLNIGGSVQKMHVGEARNGITVNKVSKDSIEVSYKKEKKVITHSRLR